MIPQVIHLSHFVPELYDLLHLEEYFPRKALLGKRNAQIGAYQPQKFHRTADLS